MIKKNKNKNSKNSINDKKNNKTNHKKEHKSRKDVIFNLPNSLTMLRIILAPVFMVLLLNNKYLAAFIVIVIASITDFLDGLLARKLNMQTNLGRILDPIADKVLIFLSVIALLIKFKFPLWVGIIILSRDIIILLGGLLFFRKKKQKFLVPNVFGKVSTLFQLTTIAVYVIASINNYYALWIDVLLYLTVAMTLLSGIIYIFQGFRILFGRPE